MKLGLLLFSVCFAGALAAGGFLFADAVAGETATQTEQATLTIPGPNSVYTGTLTVRELEMFTVTRGTETETVAGPSSSSTRTVVETVAVEIPGPRGPRGFRGRTGPPGPAGMDCPAGFSGQSVLVNTPGGQETWFVCVS